MNPSEIAFLALGVVLGSAVGAAIVEAVRARPAPRREVRITVSPNSINPRRPLTLASEDRDASRGTVPGAPDDDDWLERRLAGESTSATIRTRVPSGPVAVPPGAVAVPIVTDVRSQPSGAPPAAAEDVPRAASGGDGTAAVAGDDRTASAVRAATAVAVLDPILPGPVGDDGTEPAPAGHTFPSAVEVGAPAPGAAVRPRPPAQASPATLSPAVVAGGLAAAAETADGANGSSASGSSAGGVAAGAPAPAGMQECEGERTLVRERCALADAAREQARLAADALREAQRAYDAVREHVERAQATADPREIRAAKDAIHQAFRSARAAAATPEAVEQAAREWLNEVNRLNTAAREASHVLDAGNAELRAQLPRLERLAVEADAARITAESAEVGCRDAREALARCEERAVATAAALAASQAAAAEEPTARDLAWPTEPEPALAPATEAPGEQILAEATIVRILHGDRQARERLIATLAEGDPEVARQWQLRIAGLVDAIVARAIEDGYLDLPDEDFWGLFSHRERREIVGALSALGFRFDGLGGFADGRVPAQRDLSLAVGYAGLDRMRIRNWPREAELAELYSGATVAAAEWLADGAGDLSLGRMVDALGGRAAELADVWNAWGRVRPALLATD